ncbi:MAG: preprotein translocase subunit SecE [Deltaproteobacteria bacterium]|nr:MAG: preprotein translocase subunit SecE [Deltaproteobacteria bacterium]
MSRIQKKKPLGEKKKKDVDSDGLTDAGAKLSGSKPIASMGLQKQEKGIVEGKIGEPNFFQRTIEFFREVKVELKKVTWPTRKQTTGTTIVVIIFVFVVAAFLGLFDYGLSKLVQVVLT